MRCGVWRAYPKHHKGSHRVQERVLLFGARAQEIVKPFLLRPNSAYLFSPAEAEAERRKKQQEQRVTPLSCGNKPGSNRKKNPQTKPGNRYTANSYRKAIERAIDAANRDRLETAVEN